MADPVHLATLRSLFGPDGRLIPRLAAVARLDPTIYEEIEADPAAIPQAFAVVIGTAVLAGLGQGSLPGVFLGIATAIVLWSAMTGLIWTAAQVWVGGVEYSQLLRGTGFAWAWFSVLFLSWIPVLGSLIAWAGLALCVVSSTLATRSVLQTSWRVAATICAAALGLPILIALLLV